MHKCDSCGAPVRVKGDVPAGAKLRCPKCAASARTAPPAAAPAAAPAGGASRRPAAAPAASSGAAAPAARPAAATARAPARAAPAARASAAAEATAAAEQPRRSRNRGGGGLDKVQKIGLAVAGAIAIITVIVVFTVNAKTSAKAAAWQAHLDEVQAILKDVSTADLTKQSEAERVIKKVADTRHIWIEDDVALQIEKFGTIARGALETAKATKETVGELEKLEAKFKDPGRTAEDLEQMKRELQGGLKEKCETISKDLGDRANKLLREILDAYAGQLLTDADNMAATPGKERDALRLYGKAEEETRKVVDAAHKAKDKAAIDLYVGTYTKIIAGYDTTADKLFTRETIDSLPWTDYLSGPESTKWNPSKGVEGFTARIVNGALEITGANPEVRKIGVVSIGDLTPWRDFELEMEFTMEKGATDILFHLGATTNQYVKAEPLGVDPTKDTPNPNLQRGKTYKLSVKWIGSTARFALSGENAPEAKRINMGWQFYRKGALGFQVEPTTRMRITKFRVKDYR